MCVRVEAVWPFSARPEEQLAVLERMRRRLHSEEPVAFVWHGERRPLRPIAWVAVGTVCLASGFFLGQRWTFPGPVETVVSDPSQASLDDKVADRSPLPAQPKSQPPPVTIINPGAGENEAPAATQSNHQSKEAIATRMSPAPAASRPQPPRSRSADPERAPEPRQRAEAAEPRGRVHDYDDLRAYMLRQR